MDNKQHDKGALINDQIEESLSYEICTKVQVLACMLLISNPEAKYGPAWKLGHADLPTNTASFMTQQGSGRIPGTRKPNRKLKATPSSTEATTKKEEVAFG